jgi:GTP-binding protein HflX
MPNPFDPIPEPEPGTRAVLVAVQKQSVSDAELQASLDELERLAGTLGLRCVARITQRRSGSGSATLLGAGKLRELAEWTGGTGRVPSGASRRTKGSKPDEPEEEEEVTLPIPEDEAELDGELEPVPTGKRAAVVLVDHDLGPSQLRNLENATGAEVLDRSSVILSIFQRHARTREARLQVEIARLAYLAPRLRETGAGADRQRGGIGGKGVGESALELDRRRIRDRIAELKESLEAVQREAQTRRARRSSQATVALVGYTNAGKSSLMRALTRSDVLVADQLFATLDTTTRVMVPETHPKILLSDTVGFIKQLPHDLVASFRSTLEEARDADLLIHVVDAADPAWRSQLEVTRQVLAEIGAGDHPSLVVLNKADRLTAAERAALAAEVPDALLTSAFDRADIAALHGRILGHFEQGMIEDELFVSYRTPKRVHEIHEACHVISETYEDEGVRLRVRARPDRLDELRARLAPGD